jgi:integrase
MSKLVTDVNKQGYKNSTNDTLETLMRHWLMIYKKPEVASRTFESIMRRAKLHIFSEIGDMQLKDISTDTVQTLLNSLHDRKGLCLDTVKKIRQQLNQYFTYAEEKNFTDYNPVAKTKLKARDRDKYRKENKETYKAVRKEDRAAFLGAISKHYFWKPLCLTGMFCGLRIGEILALKWRDIDLENGIISIENSVTQVCTFDAEGNVTDRKTVIGDTKTAASERENPMADVAVNALKEYKNRRKLEEALLGKTLTAPSDIVFSTNDGGLRTYWGTHTLFSRFLEKHKLQGKGIHFHTLRHTFSNMLFEAGENPKVIQALMGHKDVRTTMIYNSVDKYQVSRAKGILDKVSSGYEM